MLFRNGMKNTVVEDMNAKVVKINTRDSEVKMKQS